MNTEYLLVLMQRRPYTILSIAASLDGFIDGQGPERFVFSNPANLAQIDELRAESDAILIGAGTLRRDNPKLLVRSLELQNQRLAKGRSRNPAKVLLASSSVSTDNNFFRLGDSSKIIFCGSRTQIDGAADRTEIVRHASERYPLGEVLNVLCERGVARLLVEGGTQISTAFLRERLIDELWLTLPPIMLGPSGGARLVSQELMLDWLSVKETSQQGGCLLVKYGVQIAKHFPD